MQHCRHLEKLLLALLAVCGVLSSPVQKDKDELEEIFTGSKRDVTSTDSSAILKSALFNPYAYPLFPGKPFFYPFLTPPDILLNRFAKSTSDEKTSPRTPLQASTSTSDAYFKSKKNEFLTKLFEQISNASDTADITARSVTTLAEDSDETTKPTIDPSFFINKKLDFLEKLFKSLNNTTTTPTTPTAEVDTFAPPKPTIVPPSFWFPIIKPPKPPKAPKPTKPPKTKKILKDALDTAILQSLLTDLGIDPLNGMYSKRAATPVSGAKKTKSKKVKPEEETTEFHIPTKIDPSLYSTKASDCLDKLFKILSKADAEDLSTFIEPKATVIPTNMWTQPSETEYTSKLDAFLDLLLKSLNATDAAVAPGTKASKSKKPSLLPKKIRKRSTFLDELLHRIPPTPATTPATSSSDCDCSKKTNCCCCGKCSEDVESTDKSDSFSIFKPLGTSSSDCDCSKKADCCCCGKCSVDVESTDKSARSLIFKPLGTSSSDCDCSKKANCCCCGKCSVDVESTDKSARSLIFKPFGTGYWIPQYLYAAKMSLYLDKLMNTINTAAAEDISTDASTMKRSVQEDSKVNITGLSPKEAAVTLLIAELVDLKNDIVDAFADGVKAQKSASTTKPFNTAGKSFKKPFWGPKASPTPDPVEPIQKRIDILNEIFDKITEVEKTLLFSDDPNDPKVLKSVEDVFQPNTKVGSSRLMASKTGKVKGAEDTHPQSPDFYIEKAREILQSIYASNVNAVNDGDY